VLRSAPLRRDYQRQSHGENADQEAAVAKRNKLDGAPLVTYSGGKDAADEQ
jgi:hypothetical protein